MPDIAKALAMLAGGNSVGDSFFEIAASALILGMDCRWAGVSCLSDNAKSVEVMTLAGADAPFSPARYLLQGMPAEALYADPSPGRLLVLDDVAARFPKYQEVVGIALERYSATLFHHADGRPAGHIFILDDRPVTRDADDWEFFNLVCERVGAEYSMRSGFAGNAWLDKVVDGTETALVVTNSMGQIVLANNTYANWIGFSKGSDVVGSNVEQWIEPTAQAANRQAIAKLLHQGNIETYESMVRDRHGATREIVVVVTMDRSPAGARLVALMRDNSNRKNVERARLESEARLTAIIKNAPFSIILKDREGRYVTMNRQAEDWLKTTIAEAAGQLPDAIHNLSSGELERRKDLEVLNEGRIVSYEVDGSVNNTRRTLWTTKFPILGEDGSPTGLGTIVSDITERKQAESLLQRQMEAAERSNDAKTRFLAAASHDLRQPLHSMELMLEILGRMVQEPAQQELISDIVQAAAIASGLLNPLLDFSRLEAGMVEPEIDNFPIASVLRDMEAGFRTQAEEAGLQLRIVPNGAMVRSDPVLLSLIVSNFLSNAVRYTESGRILLGCRRHGARLRVEVWDTGPGIESEHLESIFEEFRQINTVTRDRDKGLGLGLAIVKAQASLLKHEVKVAAWPGRGSVFSIEVPVVAPLGRQVPAPANDAGTPEFLAGLRMLVLEDNPGILRATKALLERWGCEVATASTRDDAIAIIAAETAMLDLIIADYHLEHGDNGVDTVAQIRDRLDYDVPAIIVTADISNENLRRDEKNTFPVLQKPFRPAALRAAIGQAILDDAAAS